MKTFSIQQPWGTLICCGLKDVENRKWALKTLPTTLLIHTGARRQKIDEDTMPWLWQKYIDNYQNMGILPWMSEFPTSALIGVATVEACVEESDSVWAQEGPGAEYKWVMKDVKLFKEPIQGVKGKLGIFDYPEISEDNLPECVEIPQITREGKTVRIPWSQELIDQIKEGKANAIYFNITDEIDRLFFNGDDRLETETIILFSPTEEITREVKRMEVVDMTYDDGEVIKYPDQHDNMEILQRLYIDFK